MQVIKSSCLWTSLPSVCLPQRKQHAARLRDGNTFCGLSASKPAYRCPEASTTCGGWCWAYGTRPDCPFTRSLSFLRATGRWHPCDWQNGRILRPSPQRSFFRLIRFPYTFSFDVIIPFAAKEYITRYPTMASPKVTAYCADTVAIVREHHTETVLFAWMPSKRKGWLFHNPLIWNIIYIVVW